MEWHWKVFVAIAIATDLVAAAVVVVAFDVYTFLIASVSVFALCHGCCCCCFFNSFFIFIDECLAKQIKTVFFLSIWLRFVYVSPSIDLLAPLTPSERVFLGTWTVLNSDFKLQLATWFTVRHFYLHIKFLRWPKPIRMTARKKNTHTQTSSWRLLFVLLGLFIFKLEFSLSMVRCLCARAIQHLDGSAWMAVTETHKNQRLTNSLVIWIIWARTVLKIEFIDFWVWQAFFLCVCVSSTSFAVQILYEFDFVHWENENLLIARRFDYFDFEFRSKLRKLIRIDLQRQSIELADNGDCIWKFIETLHFLLASTVATKALATATETHTHTDLPQNLSRRPIYYWHGKYGPNSDFISEITCFSSKMNWSFFITFDRVVWLEWSVRVWGFVLLLIVLRQENDLISIEPICFNDRNLLKFCVCNLPKKKERRNIGPGIAFFVQR